MSILFRLRLSMLFMIFSIFAPGASAGRLLVGVTMVEVPWHLFFPDPLNGIDERELPYKQLRPILEKLRLPFEIVTTQRGEKQLDDAYLYEEGRLARLAKSHETSIERVKAKINIRKPKMSAGDTAILCDVYTIGRPQPSEAGTIFSGIESNFEESLKKYLFDTRYIPTAYTFYQKVQGQETKLPFQTLFNPVELLVIQATDSTIYVLEASIGPSIINARLKTKPEDIRFAVYVFKIKTVGDEKEDDDDETPVGQFKQVDTWTLSNLEEVEAYLKTLVVTTK